MNSNWLTGGASPEGFDWQGGAAVDMQSGMRLEAVIGDPNFKAIWWLHLATNAARSVCRIKLAGGSATGFLIAPDIVMTNNHVFENETDASNATLQFNYRLSSDGTPEPRDDWTCDPDDMFKTNPSLDYSITRVKKKSNKNAGDEWGYFNLRHGVQMSENQRVNIIQHPQGRFQEIAFRDNQIKHVGSTYIQYLTDTDYGTSGSPVFDDFFNVVALHNQRVRDPATGSWYRNQGYRVDSILSDAGALIP